MECPRCRYALSAFDVECPRCKHFTKLGIVPPTFSETVKQVDTDETDSERIAGQSMPVVSTNKSWYSKLDFDDNNAASEFSDASLPAEPVLLPTTAHASKPSEFSQASSLSDEVNFFTPKTIAPLIQSQGNPSFSPSITTATHSGVPRFSAIKLSFLIGSITVVLIFILVIFLPKTMLFREHSKTNRTSSQSQDEVQAATLISQVEVDATVFQQTDMSPIQCAQSFRTRTRKCQEAIHLCQLAQTTDSKYDKGQLIAAARKGIAQVQIDTQAEDARIMTADVSNSIAVYKTKVLTVGQAATVRTRLIKQCLSALSTCEYVLQKDPNNCVALAEQIRALQFLGRTKSASAALSRALHICPENPILLREKDVHI